MKTPSHTFPRPNPFSCKEGNPAYHKIFGPSGIHEIPAGTTLEKIMRYSQPVIVDKPDCVAVADVARIFDGEQARNIAVSDLTEENSDWWAEPANALAEMAVAKQARHITCSAWSVSWEEYDLGDNEPMFSPWPLQAIAEYLEMKFLPCIGMPLSEFTKGKDWREWLAEETILVEDLPLPDSEPAVAKIRYNYSEEKERYDGAEVLFDLDGLWIYATEDYWV